MDATLPQLKSFILPGGSISVSHCHLCRTVTRRAERRVIELGQEAPQIIGIYLNRLSDYFFILGRYVAHIEGIEEVKWEK
jgi:cob(I)alamin adenosyltransferase